MKIKYRNNMETNQNGFSAGAIMAYAERLNIMPGIVVGRLQQDGRLPYQTSLNSLKEKYLIG